MVLFLRPCPHLNKPPLPSIASCIRNDLIICWRIDIPISTRHGLIAALPVDLLIISFLVLIESIQFYEAMRCYNTARKSQLKYNIRMGGEVVDPFYVGYAQSNVTHFLSYFLKTDEKKKSRIKSSV